MRKIIFFVLSLTFISAILFGCQSKVNTDIKSDLDIKKVSISKSKGFGKVNPDFFAVFDDEKNLKLFKSVISNAVKVDSTVDMATPKYDLEVTYNNGSKQGFHLWIGDKGKRGTLMDINDTNTIYTVLEENTNKLIDLIQ